MKKLSLLFALLALGVCEVFAAPATLKEFSGELKILRMFKRLEPKVGMVLEPKDMIMTKADGKAVVILPDESTVSVGPDSTLKLTQFLSPNDKSRNVELELIEGASLFSVVKKMEESTFVVRTPTAVAGVRGTSFMMKHKREGGKYRSSIAVFKGLVSVSPVRNQLQKNVRAIFLAAMTKSIVEQGQSPSAAITMSRSEVQQFASEVGISTSTGSSTGGARADASGSSVMESLGVDMSAPVAAVAVAPKVILPIIPKSVTIDTSKIIKIIRTVEDVRPIEVKRIIEINRIIEDRKRVIAPPPKQPTNPNAQ